jgi:hypothetical protein
MTKIYCYDSFNPKSGKTVWDGIDYQAIRYQASRCFMAAKKGDLAILPPCQDSLDSIQVLPILNEIGLAPRKEDILYIGWEQNQIDDPNQDIKTLRKITFFKNYLIEVFTGQAILPHYIARVTHSKINASPPNVAEMAENKVFFQTLNADSIPKAVVINEFEQAEPFFKQLSDQYIVKTAKNTSGLSAFFLTPENAYEALKETFQLLNNGKFLILQKYYPHTLSPSVNLEINANGKIIPLFISEQLLGKSSKGVPIHEGNLYPVHLPLQIKHDLIKQSIKIAQSVSRIGYYGSIGVDWIINLNPDWYGKAVEVNSRITAPKLPFIAMKQLGAQSFYIKKISLSHSMTADEIRNKIDPLFWCPDKKEGVIFYDFNYLKGKLIIAGFGSIVERTIELVHEAEKWLSNNDRDFR